MEHSLSISNQAEFEKLLATTLERQRQRMREEAAAREAQQARLPASERESANDGSVKRGANNNCAEPEWCEGENS